MSASTTFGLYDSYEYIVFLLKLQMVCKLWAGPEQTPPWALLVMLSNARCIFYDHTGAYTPPLRTSRAKQSEGVLSGEPL